MGKTRRFEFGVLIDAEKCLGPTAYVIDSIRNRVTLTL